MGRETQGFASLPPAQRALAASIGSLTNWSRHTSPEARREATAPARAGRRRKLEQQVDPDGKLPPAELEAAVARLRRAQYMEMALKSAQVRAARRSA